MLQQENLAANFCGLLTRQHNYKKSAIEWRILGQEQDGSMLASWISLAVNETPIERSHIGLYNAAEKTFHILHSFEKRENCIQASVNSSRTLLAYVLKDPCTKAPVTDEPTLYLYKPFIIEIKRDGEKSAANCKNKQLMGEGSRKQVMVQFLWQKKSIFEKKYEDTLLQFVHDDCITMLKTKLIKNVGGDDDEGSSSKIDLKNFNSWSLDCNAITGEVIVKHFIWAQWDPSIQALYYIHLKATTKSSLDKDDDKANGQEISTTTTLSAHQFHENSPRETVVSSNRFPFSIQTKISIVFFFTVEHSTQFAKYSTKLRCTCVRRRRRTTSYSRLIAEFDNCYRRIRNAIRLSLLHLSTNSFACRRRLRFGHSIAKR